MDDLIEFMYQISEREGFLNIKIIHQPSLERESRIILERLNQKLSTITGDYDHSYDIHELLHDDILYRLMVLWWPWLYSPLITNDQTEKVYHLLVNEKFKNYCLNKIIAKN